MSITVTEKALNEIKKVMNDQNLPFDSNLLEIGISGSGCSGFQYKLNFKKKNEVDQLNSTFFSFGDLEVFVENRILNYLQGITLDFYEGTDKRGFLFNNPNAKSGCGCGSSCSA